MCPPISWAPWGSRAERMPARVCASSISWVSDVVSGRVITACAAVTRAPQAHRSEQACRAVRRPFSQGSLIRAGKPSTLCSTGAMTPSVCTGSTAASSGAEPRLPIPACCRALSKGAAGNLAAQPRQAIAAASSIAALRSNMAMKRASIERFQRHSSGWGPKSWDPAGPMPLAARSGSPPAVAGPGAAASRAAAAHP